MIIRAAGARHLPPSPQNFEINQNWRKKRRNIPNINTRGSGIHLVVPFVF
jgi:hypothetical protein